MNKNQMLQPKIQNKFYIEFIHPTLDTNDLSISVISTTLPKLIINNGMDEFKHQYIDIVFEDDITNLVSKKFVDIVKCGTFLKQILIHTIDGAEKIISTWDLDDINLTCIQYDNLSFALDGPNTITMKLRAYKPKVYFMGQTR